MNASGKCGSSTASTLWLHNFLLMQRMRETYSDTIEGMVPVSFFMRYAHRRILGLTLCLCCALFVQLRAEAQIESAWDTARVWTDFEEALVRPERVQRLDLTKEKWKAVDHRLRRFRNLHELILDKNRLDSLPPWISEFQSLERLSIRGNRLTEVPLGILGLEALRELDLSDNMIAGIPEDIDALTRLERLLLWSNVIGHFPPSLSHLDALTELDLLNNEMSVDEQIWVRELLPGRMLHFSPPCRCDFDD